MTAPEQVPAAAASAAVEAGEATLLDLRSPPEFARGYPAGAICVPFSDKRLAERVALVIEPARGALILVVSDAEDAGGTDAMAPAAAQIARRAVAQLDEGGFRVRGVLQGGVRAWAEAGHPVEQLHETAAAALAPTAGRVTLDVREPLEWDTGHVPGALLIRLAELPARIDEVPRDQPVDVLCEAGIRSVTAASLLRARGYREVTNVPAGTAGYRVSGRPLAYPDSSEGAT